MAYHVMEEKNVSIPKIESNLSHCDPTYQLDFPVAIDLIPDEIMVVEPMNEFEHTISDPWDSPLPIPRFECPPRNNADEDEPDIPWYRGFWPFLLFLFLLSLLPTLIFSIMIFIPDCLGILTTYAYSTQNGKIELPDPTFLFEEVILSETTLEKKTAKMRSLKAYVKILIYFTLPEDFYFKTFGVNYKSLLEDCYKKQLLKRQELIRLYSLDLELHEEQVVMWIDELTGRRGPAGEAFSKFRENLKDLKFMTCHQNDYFFNQIQKRRIKSINIKKYYTDIEKKIEKNVIYGIW